MKDARGHGSEKRGAAAHQSGITSGLRSVAKSFGNLALNFGKSESGAGHPPAFIEHAIVEAAKEPSVYIHAGHFFGAMAGLAVADGIALYVAHLLGVTLT